MRALSPIGRHLGALLGVLMAGGLLFAWQSWRTARAPMAVAEPGLVQHLGDGDIDYWTSVRPILEQRCVVCHGCYDAPCQLKLTAIEGLARGASKDAVYVATRVKSAPPSRLFVDQANTPGWRQAGFFPIAPDHPGNSSNDVMARMLALKVDHPLPANQPLPDSLDVDPARRLSCPKAEEFDEYARRNPLGGMPYALAGLPAKELDVLQRWLQQGATYTARAPLAAPFHRQVATWEQFLNQDPAKARLMSRYLYEHLFLAHLYFPDLSDDTFFRLVRSSTPPGEPVQIIASRRPYDDPKVPRVYYRLVPDHETTLAKTNMPYALTPAREAKWTQWFLDDGVSVTALPSYDVATAANPFITFKDIPAQSRYRFLLDEAEYTIMGFIKGPVCRGQTALNVIDDHFWVLFQNPDRPQVAYDAQFMSTQFNNLELPAGDTDFFSPLEHWRNYSQKEKRFIDAVARYIEQKKPQLLKMDLGTIWDGDGHNDNAALTVFRHFDSATVAKGLLGGTPKTAWLLTYPRLERIHYLLVAGYDVYGNAGHQFITRVYMDFLRMESEAMFLHLLPQAARKREMDNWYRGATEEARQFMELPDIETEFEAGIHYVTDDPKRELFGKIGERLAPVLAHAPADESQSKMLREFIDGASTITGIASSLLPEVTVVEIVAGERSRYLTLLANRAHLNLTSLFDEQANRVPVEDTLSVVDGIGAAYPNAFLRVTEDDLPVLLQRLRSLARTADVDALFAAHGVSRTSPDFWGFSDRMHEHYRQQGRTEYGVLDFGRLERY